MSIPNETKEPEVNASLALEHGLSAEEYERILGILGRVPSWTELGMFSVMWSEHCSYKNSIAELKKLPRTGEKLLVGAGEENAGLVDIGDGLAVAFKIESHNHPSAVEPYQGAATGVGGIMRDIFTMGARPIAALNSLRFGSFSHPRTKYLLKGIVKGIGDYGNSFGVPTVAGEVYFDECYNENPLVNAMAVGIVKHGEVAKAAARGAGNLVMIVGSSTGRDGIHGATFASEEISEESEARRPSVQVGDPFTEKLLLEATLEAVRAGLIVGIQDMGAAGITCSTSEMSARGECGMRIDLDRVPAREAGMSGYELMLSESQERMLLVARPEHRAALISIFEKWDLPCSEIGTVTDDGRLVVEYEGRTIADVPADSLVLGGGAPVYHRESRRPDDLDRLHELDTALIPEPDDYNTVMLRLLSSPNLCSRRWVTTQYDSTVRTNTLIDAAGDAAVVRIKGTKRALAMKTDCNSRYVYLDPYRGSQIAVGESARNVVCVGAKPLAITNCLNFGNPYKPEIFWQFKESVRGISDACRALNTPVTGGNVSFYNDSPSGVVYPTPVIGMLGEIDDVAAVLSPDFKDAGDLVVLLGDTKGHLGGSEYLSAIHGIVRGMPPELDLDTERRLQSLCLELAGWRLLRSAHDVSEGGLAVAIAECSLFAWTRRKSLGARIELPGRARMDFLLFGEDQSRILVTIRERELGQVMALTQKYQVKATAIGQVIPDRLEIGREISLQVAELGRAYERRLEEEVGGRERP